MIDFIFSAVLPEALVNSGKEEAATGLVSPRTVGGLF